MKDVQKSYLYGKAWALGLAGQLAVSPHPGGRGARALRREGDVVVDVLAPRRQEVGVQVVIRHSLIGGV